MKFFKLVAFLTAACPMLTLIAPTSSAFSTSYNAANPWRISPTQWFSSPAELAAYEIATEDPAYPIYLVNITGPYTSSYDGVGCSETNPCMTPNFEYSTISGGFGIVIQYQGTGAYGQLCADGSYAPVGQACVGNSLGMAPSCSCLGKVINGDVAVGDPIDVGSGNKVEEAIDYETFGQNPLGFRRYYNSRASFTTLAATLGIFWRSNYDRYIRMLSSNLVIAERQDGRQLAFTLIGGVWTPESDVDVTLIESGSTWTLTDHEDTVETYSTNSVNTGAMLNSIKARSGYTLNLSYLDSRLMSVTDSYGRSLALTYTAGLLSSVQTPDGTTISYGYTTTNGSSTLTSVSYPTSPPSSVEYLYEDTNLPAALTGIIDENNNRYATWTYDPFSRALSSSLGSSNLNADQTTVSYNDTDGSRIVTNALGVRDTYKFAVLQGVPKVSEIDRASTGNTAASQELFTYDSNGYVASQTDWNGNLTTFVNDVHGDPITTNEAVGTTVARTTTIAYDPLWVHLPDSITTPELTTSYTYDAEGNPLTRVLTDTTTTAKPYITKGQNRIWTYTWSNFLLASLKTPNGNSTKYSYSPSGALIQILNPLNQATNITQYTGGGYPNVIVDPNIVSTTLVYDARERILSISVSGNGGTFITVYGRDAVGELTKLTLPDSSYQVYGYDSAHRLTQVADALGNYVHYTLDSLGDRTQVNTYDGGNKLWRQHSATFDALGRTLTDVGGVGQTTTYSYDQNGNALTVSDPLKHQTTRTFDAFNRLSTKY